jgi:hypothetical protein
MWNECRERDSIFLQDKSMLDRAFFAIFRVPAVKKQFSYFC